jgi:hypothetical protein
MEKLLRIFEIAPHLSVSNAVVHIPIPNPDYNPDVDKPDKRHLPGLTWKELHEFVRNLRR